MRSTLARIVFVALVLATAIFLSLGLLANGQAQVALMLMALGVGLAVVFLWDRLRPLRWIAPGLALMILMILYPVANTVTLAFTNYGDGHLLTRDQAIRQLLDVRYVPDDGRSYTWIAYRAEDGRFLLRITGPDGVSAWATPSGPTAVPDPAATGSPDAVDGYRRLQRPETVRFLGSLQATPFETPDGVVVHITSLDVASPLLPRYDWDAGTERLTDLRTGAVYTSVEGRFTDAEGRSIEPGFAAPVGLANFTDILTERTIREPFVGVFVWTVAFATLSVLLTFGLGLVLALALNDPRLPGRGLLRTASLVPYTLPIFISAPLWVGLLNPFYGPVNQLLERLTGASPDWFGDPTFARIAVLLVNLWVGFPYMMVICLGALQAIPRELEDAATVDGAGTVARVRMVVLPLLLASVAPLLVGAFAFSFNNFAIIDLVTRGGPPNLSTVSPAGQTDILISYTYRLAFTSGTGAKYGLAAAISMLIFAIVVLITLLNFRLSRRYEEAAQGA